MKTRLLAMGCIVSAVAVVRILMKGFDTVLAAVLGAGIVLFVGGVLWPSRRR